MKRPGLRLGLVAALLYGFLYVPLAAVVVASFNAARFGAEWRGFTLEWYRTLGGDAQAWAATRCTLEVALASTLVATVLGTLLGYGLERGRFPGRDACHWLLQIPVFLPDIVLAVALLLFYAAAEQLMGGPERGRLTMILAHVTFEIPFVAIVVRARLLGIDPALEEAARDLGADEWRTFRWVTLPLLRPGILAGAMLAFTLSLDDFVVSFFTNGPGATTLPILIYSSVKRGVTPEINALSTLVVLASLAGTLGAAWLQRKRRPG